MTDPDTKYKHSKRRKRNFIAKKMYEGGFTKKIHLDEKTKSKQEKWTYDEYYSEDDEDNS